MKILFILLTLLIPLVSSAQVTVTNTFTPFTVISAAQFNTNFTELSEGALNRDGGTITGNITVDSGVTIDGIDISSVLHSDGTVVVSATGTNALIIGGGIQTNAGAIQLVNAAGKISGISSFYFASMDGNTITNLNAANLSGTLGALNGSNLTNLTAANITGTLPNAVQDAITRLGTVTSGTFSGTLGAISGAALTSLNASNLSSGTVATSRLGSGTADSTTFLRGDQTWVSIGEAAAVPTGAIFYFNAACPSGYAEFTNARGNVIVGVPLGGTLNTQVGTAFSNLEARTHTHDVAGHTHTAGSLNGPSHTHGPGTLKTQSHDHQFDFESVQSGSGAGVVGNMQSSSLDITSGVTAASGTGNVTGSTAANASQTSTVNNVNILPYIQLRACQKS